MQMKRLSLMAAAIISAAFMLGGCSDGKDGRNGLNAGQGTVDASTVAPETLAALQLTGQVTSVSINSPPVVNFRITDSNGNPIKGLGVASPTSSTSLNYLRFTVAKLVPGATTHDRDQWVSYMVTSTSRPTTENVAANLVDNGDGSYTYTFAKNITDPTQTNNVTYEPTLTHRLVIQVSGSVPNASTPISLAKPTNIIYDWVPAGGAVSTKREITTTEACNECHDKIGVTTPHGGRIDTRYCVVCHNDQRRIGRTNLASVAGAFSAATYIADGEVLGDFVTMVHKIHMGNKLTKTGYDYAGVTFNDVGYPQDQKNCRKCHKLSAAAPQGDNWKTKPTRAACGACHDNVNFATGANALAGTGTHVAHSVQTTDANCAGCHKTEDIETAHLTDNATPNNPSVPAGAVNFTYDINTVSVNGSNQAVIKFRILSDGGTGAAPTPVVFTGTGSTATTPPANAVISGFSGSPAFLMAYSLSGTNQTIGSSNHYDFNNFGMAAAQPASIRIAELLAAGNTKGTISGPDSSGYYTATITAAASNFPAGAKLRTVGLQAYFTQVTPAVARHTKAVVKTVTGDTARRTVVDSDKCAKCHEWFEGHGGNRVYEIAICTLCHVPNLSTSGRGASVANLDATNNAALTAAGYNAADPSTWPEASNNLKDMIHGIHAGSMRAAAGNPYRFVRDRGTSGVFYYDWSEVVFPGQLNNCEMCHKPGTYGTVSANALASTNETLGAGTVAQNRASLPNATDKVTTPLAATCISCHGYGGAVTATAHMNSNGVAVNNNVLRSTLGTAFDQCTLCHTNDKVAAPSTVHKPQ
ncbi:OmcA/MtrC family decaheme c-type cytochrome [Citrifermentans pelophilum]|nr:OmcA/MtrC family decaheme c-type cytochrome [Geoanaerobacter pelophilus]